MEKYSRFICATKEYNTYEKHISAPLLRKSFRLSSKPENAKITVSGLGFYRLFVNGTEVTKGLLAPYISNSDDIVYFDEYDVADLLTEGENVLGAILGNGMQNCPGGAVWDFHLAKFRSAPKLSLYLEADETAVETDESWKCAESPIFFDDLRSGCFYDANRETEGWNQSGFDDSLWQNAFFAERPRGEYRICDAEPIRVQREIKPVSVTENTLEYFKSGFDNGTSGADGTPLLKSLNYPTVEGDSEGYLYDFGVNTAGVYRLKIKGEKGQRVIIQALEYLPENGKTQFRNIGGFYPTGYGQRDVYILKGEGVEEFIPSFTYHGCRYYHISGITPEQATADLITYLEAYSDFPEKGRFNCSDGMMNKLYEMCMRSAKSNFYYFPTDCPHREKNGWTGDASYSAEYMLMNFGAEKSFREWQRNICKAQNDKGALPGIVPTAGWGFHWGNGPAWDRVIVYLPYYTYLYTGDRQIMEESAHGIMRYLEYLTGKSDEKGLYAFGLGDWCPPGKATEAYDSPLKFTDTVMVMSICEKAAYIFGELGLTLQKAFAEGLYNKARTAVRENLIDFSTMTASGNCQTSQAMSIFYNVFDECEKSEAFQRLLDCIDAKNGHFDSGYLGNRVIFHVLSMFGKTDLALNMILRPDFPSYTYPILQYDATSMWEDMHLEPKNSLNHHFFGDIANFFIKRVAGLLVNPNRNSPNEYEIKPNFAEILTFAEADFLMPCGKISVKWEKSGDKITLTLDAPEGSCGVIKLPEGYVFENTDQSTLIGASGVFTVIKA